MALIHKQTFDIIQWTNIDETENDYFEVDDLIAKSISLLNKKGYTTTFCCAGHPFDEITELFSSRPLEPGVFENIISSSIKNGKYQYILRQKTQECYIAFNELYFKDDLPDGFYFGETNASLHKDYESVNESFELIYEIADTMKYLYLWVQNLPKFTKMV